MARAPEVRVLAVDPGTQVVGYAVLEWCTGRARVVEASVLRIGGKGTQASRLLALHEGLCEVIARCEPSEMAVEDIFLAKNARSALKLGQARGVVLLTAAERSLPVFEYTPAEVKQAIVGHGGASKEQVQRMVAARLGLASLPRPHDVADALAIALCHCQRVGLSRMGREE